MGATTWSRAGAASGAVGAVLYVVSAFTAGSPLKPDASVARVQAHLADHRGALLAGFLLALVAVAFLVWFLGSLRRFVAAVDGEGSPLAAVTLASWVALLVIAVSGGVPLTAVIWRGAGQVDAGTVRLAFDVGNLSLYSLSASVAAVSVLAPVMVIWRSAALPRWLVVLGAIEIVVNIVELAGLFARHGWDAGGYAWGIGPFVWVVWVAAVSLCLVMRQGGGTEVVTVVVG